MDLATISLIALFLTIAVSCTGRINPGILAIVLAWIIGVYLPPPRGTPIGVKGLASGFPSDLFLTLVAASLLFGQAQLNGTLSQVARVAMRGCRGNVGFMPVMFFLLTLGLSSIGAGSIASAAIVAPMAMAVSQRAGIDPFLMIVMVAHGAVAGAMSAFAPTGIIANQLLGTMELADQQWQTYGNNLLANAAVAFAGYLAFGGWRLFRHRHDDERAEPAEPFERRHAVTLAVVLTLLVGVIFFKVDVGMGAFAGAAILILSRQADETLAIRSIPWGVVLMVCGVTILAAVVDKTGGTELFTDLVARISTQNSVTGIIAFLTGLVSVYSSTSGVVLPAFLPIVEPLVQKLGGGEPAAIASSIIIGGNLVDVSPLSTVGALCIACVSPAVDRRILFNKLLGWGLSMAAAAGVICYLWFAKHG